MAHLTPSKVRPLIGEQSFSQLMRSRPLVVHGACLVHAQTIGALENTLKHASSLNNPSLRATIVLGLIVPKKCYPLAVDRNRVKRVVRAQALILAQHINQPIALLFRVRAAKKGEKKAKLPKPHSAAFTAQVATALCTIEQSFLVPGQANPVASANTLA